MLPHSYAVMASAIMDRLLDDFARLSWGPPHLIPEVVEPHVEEIEPLLPLDERLMGRMPPIDAREFALPFRIDQDLVEGSEAYVDAPEDTRDWDEFEGLDYVGVRDHYELSLIEDLANELTVEADASTVEADEIMSVEADELTAEADEITADNKAPSSPALTMLPDPMTTNSILFIPGGSHIASFGVQDVDSASLAFGPTLEPHQ